MDVWSGGSDLGQGVCVTKRSAPFEALTEMVRMVVGLKLRFRKRLGDLGQQVVKWVLAEGRFLLGQTVLSYLVLIRAAASVTCSDPLVCLGIIENPKELGIPLTS